MLKECWLKHPSWQYLLWHFGEHTFYGPFHRLFQRFGKDMLSVTLNSKHFLDIEPFVLCLSVHFLNAFSGHYSSLLASFNEIANWVDKNTPYGGSSSSSSSPSSSHTRYTKTGQWPFRFAIAQFCTSHLQLPNRHSAHHEEREKKTLIKRWQLQLTKWCDRI